MEGWYVGEVYEEVVVLGDLLEDVFEMVYGLSS